MVDWNVLIQSPPHPGTKKKFGPKKKSWSTNFRSSGGKSQGHQKLSKKITHFTIQFRSENLTRLKDLNSLKIRHLHCTLSWHPRTAFSENLESKCLYIPVNVCSEIFVPEMSEAFKWCFKNVLKSFTFIEIFGNSTIF